MTASEAVGGIAALLALVFLASIGSKILAVRRGELQLLLSTVPGPYSLRRPLLFALLLAESGTAASLMLFPQVGLAISAGLFSLYAAYMASITDNTPCHCFGSSFEFGSRKIPRVMRNLSLLALSVGGLIGLANVGASTFSPIALGAAGVAMLTAISVDILFRVSQELSRRRAAFPDRREVMGRQV